MPHPERTRRPVIVVCEAAGEEQLDDGRRSIGFHENEMGEAVAVHAEHNLDRLEISLTAHTYEKRRKYSCASSHPDLLVVRELLSLDNG